MLLMPDIQIRKAILLHTKEPISVITYQIFVDDKQLHYGAPKGAKVTFNYRHSSLRNVILKDMHPSFTYDTTSMAIHNYIRMDGRRDEAFEIAQQESYNPRIDVDDERSGSNNETQDDTSSSRKVDDLYMSAVRDMIAGDLMRQSR
ncbi:hypothetical protein OSB04_011009 [Centaurea solstitialis]|uniref:Uncharacterized protein n=1 Tax=Centaurea solstitialis TaxID=347529 RepID=A0AA38T8M2_9ASTR|nr:hypothetical protein OSB04_011009 [Centaurea solstitialis]